MNDSKSPIHDTLKRGGMIRPMEESEESDYTTRDVEGSRGMVERQLSLLVEDIDRLDSFLKSVVTKVHPICSVMGIDSPPDGNPQPEMSAVSRVIYKERMRLQEMTWVLEDLYNRIEL